MKCSFQVNTASTVKEALKKMTKNTYDAIVCDFWMPEKTGLDLLKELRENEKSIPFIVFTGRGREEIVTQALNYGANYFLNKHTDPEEIYRELAYGIRKIVGQHRSYEVIPVSVILCTHCLKRENMFLVLPSNTDSVSDNRS